MAGVEELSGISEGTNHPNHLPKVLPPNAITLGIAFQRRNFGGTETVSLLPGPLILLLLDP